MNNVSLVAARHYDTEHRLVISQAVLANTKESFYNAGEGEGGSGFLFAVFLELHLCEL